MKWAIAITISPLLVSVALGLLYAVLLVMFMIWWVPFEIARDCL